MNDRSSTRRGRRRNISSSVNSVRVSGIVAAAAAYLAGREVHREVGEREHLGVVALGRHDPAQQGAQPGEQLLQGEGLGQVVVGAGVEALHPVADRVAGGQHQDRYVVAGGRSARVVSIPSSRGIITSMTTTSGSVVPMPASASAPSVASDTS